MLILTVKLTLKQIEKMKKVVFIGLFNMAVFCILFLSSCEPSGDKVVGLDPSKFETTIDGKPVGLYNLENKNGVLIQITNFGGRIVSLWVPDKEGNFADVVTGYDSIGGFVTDSSYFGALIGRYGNRIANGKFTLNGVEYTLPANNAPNSLHGGEKGFDKVVWDVKKNTKDTLVLTYLSKDGEEGYPGNLSVKVIYSLNDNNELKIDYFAETDAPTIVNLTNHAYFNLAGHDSGDILDQILMINADKFTPVDSTLIPTGELRDVAGTPMDFRTPTAIGDRIDDDDQQIENGKGYDHNWVLNQPGNDMILAARAEDPESGRVLEVYTTEPGLQCYTGNFLDGSKIGKNGVPYEHRSAFCLETQHFPDSPNRDNFPSTVLNPGEKYETTIIYKFLVK